MIKTAPNQNPLDQAFVVSWTIIVLTTPILLICGGFLLADTFLSFNFYTVDLGGEILLRPTLFWLWGVPFAYALILPALGWAAQSIVEHLDSADERNIAFGLWLTPLAALSSWFFDDAVMRSFGLTSIWALVPVGVLILTIGKGWIASARPMPCAAILLVVIMCLINGQALHHGFYDGTWVAIAHYATLVGLGVVSIWAAVGKRARPQFKGAPIIIGFGIIVATALILSQNFAAGPAPRDIYSAGVLYLLSALIAVATALDWRNLKTAAVILGAIAAPGLYLSGFYLWQAGIRPSGSGFLSSACLLLTITLLALCWAIWRTSRDEDGDHWAFSFGIWSISLATIFARHDPWLWSIAGLAVVIWARSQKPSTIPAVLLSLALTVGITTKMQNLRETTTLDHQQIEEIRRLP